MRLNVAVVSVALFLSACTGPGVREAVGTGTEETPMVVRTSGSAVTVENHAGAAAAERARRSRCDGRAGTVRSRHSID